MALRPTTSLLSSLKPRRTPLSVLTFLARESPSSLPSTPLSAPLPYAARHNPFLPTKGVGALSSTAPKYSLRRQKVLRDEVDRMGWSPEVLPKGMEKRSVRREEGKVFGRERSVPKTKVLDEVEVEKKGPYTGRRTAFKGKIWERNFGKRQEELKVLLEGAGRKADEWKKTRTEERRKSKSLLPF